MIEKLKKLLDENNVSKDDQEKVIKGFNSISFKHRKLIFGALQGHPELISTFIDLINKKSKNFSDKEADSIVKEEENILEKIFKNI